MQQIMAILACMATIEQPYVYRHRELVEPDWTRLPGFAGVTAAQWADVQWQRAHCVKNLRQLRELMGDLLLDEVYADLERDQAERATMSMLVPPQMLNTMVPATHEPMPSAGAEFSRAFLADPVRRYMLPVFSDRHAEWPSHPHATRDSLHEHDMWVTEGLTHRYPTKVLAELLPTCPQYCGHCTRMDLVGNSTPRCSSSSWRASPSTGMPRCWAISASTPRCVTSSSAAATWPTCRGRTSRPSSTDCSRSTTCATSGSPPRP